MVGLRLSRHSHQLLEVVHDTEEAGLRRGMPDQAVFESDRDLAVLLLKN